MMICKKCDHRINTGAKCMHCGYDNSESNKTQTQNLEAAKKRKTRKGPVTIAVMVLFALLGVLTVLSQLGIIAGNGALANLTLFFPYFLGLSNSIFTFAIPGHYLIVAVVTISVAVFEIVLCVNIFRQNKWAYKAYAVVIAAGGVLRVVSDAVRIGAIPEANVVGSVIYSIVPFILKGILLILVYMIDGKHGGIPIDEPASSIVARKKREK